MTIHQHIRNLSVKELAEVLVREIADLVCEEINEGYEDIDGERHDFYITHFTTPDGSYSYDYEDAVLHTIDWLNADYREVE